MHSLTPKVMLCWQQVTNPLPSHCKHRLCLFTVFCQISFRFALYPLYPSLSLKGQEINIHVVLQWLSQSRMHSAVSSLGMLGCRQYVQSRSIKQCSICTTACSVDIRHLLYTSASHLHNIVQQVRPSAATLCTQCITADAFDLAKATRGHASHHSLLPGSQELALVPCPRTYWFRMLPVLHTSLLSATSFDSQYSCKLMVSTSTSCVPVFRACNFIVADLC